jgi:hypothetical protein
VAVLAAILAVWLLWPASPDEHPDAASPHAAGLSAEKAAPKAVDKARTEKAAIDKPAKPRAGKDSAPARPRVPEPSPVLRARRDLLLAAVRARAASLRPCVPGDAVEARVPVRLHVLKTGAVRSLEFSGDPPGRQIGDCVRRVAASWSFADVELPGDVELFATLLLSPGA